MLLMMVVMVLAIIGIVIGLIALTSTGTINSNIKAGANSNNKNITLIGITVSNSIAGTLIPISKNLTTTSANLNTQITTLESSISTTVSTGISAGLSGISAQLGSITTQLSTISSSLSGMSNQESGNQANITKIINLVSKNINLTENISTNSIGNIKIPLIQTNIGTGGVIYGTLLPGFGNHLIFNATEPITLTVFVVSSYNTAPQQLIYTNWCSQQSTANANTNSIKIWFNYTQQSQQNFAYVITGVNSLVPFTINSNTIAVYNSSIRINENCGYQ